MNYDNENMSDDDEQWSDFTQQWPDPEWLAEYSPAGDEIASVKTIASTDDEDWPVFARASLFGRVRFVLRRGRSGPGDTDAAIDPLPDLDPVVSRRPAVVRTAGGLLRSLGQPLLVATGAFAVTGVVTALWFPGSSPSPTTVAAVAGSAQPFPIIVATPGGASQVPAPAVAPTAASASPPATVPGSGASTFSAVTGPSCRSTASASFSPVGYWTDGGLDGWLSDNGGLASAGCTGTFLAMPMSGDSTTSAGNGGSWLFNPGASAGTCAASVYIPAVANAVYNGGNPAYYSVSDALTGGQTLGSVSVNQGTASGTWVSLGQYPVPASGVLDIQLSDRGVDWTADGPDYAHISVDAAQLDCKA